MAPTRQEETSQENKRELTSSSLLLATSAGEGLAASHLTVAKIHFIPRQLILSTH